MVDLIGGRAATTTLAGLHSRVLVKAGPQGLPGNDGADGQDGQDGGDGTNGAPGASWYQGTTAPASGLGIVGDWYIRTTTFDIFQKTGAAEWTSRGNIKGAGDVNGPSSAVTNRIVLFDGATGKVLKDSGVLLTELLTNAAAPELIRDTIGAALVAGTGITLTVNDPGDTITIASAGGAGALLARVIYNPTSNVLLSTSSATPVAVDSALQITFTASSAQADITLNANASNGSNAGSNWSLLRAGANVAGSNIEVASLNSSYRVGGTIRVTGLTPGTSYTFAWAYRGESGSACRIHVGGTSEFSGRHYGPAIMEARAA